MPKISGSLSSSGGVEEESTEQGRGSCCETTEDSNATGVESSPVISLVPTQEDFVFLSTKWLMLCIFYARVSLRS